VSDATREEILARWQAATDARRAAEQAERDALGAYSDACDQSSLAHAAEVVARREYRAAVAARDAARRAEDACEAEWDARGTAS